MHEKRRAVQSSRLKVKDRKRKTWGVLKQIKIWEAGNGWIWANNNWTNFTLKPQEVFANQRSRKLVFVCKLNTFGLLQVKFFYWVTKEQRGRNRRGRGVKVVGWTQCPVSRARGHHLLQVKSGSPTFTSEHTSCMPLSSEEISHFQNRE